MQPFATPAEFVTPPADGLTDRIKFFIALNPEI
jgi:hypothetical protein